MSNTPPTFRRSEFALALLVLAALLLFMLAQHQLVFLYHDDYGVAVLDYPAASTAGPEWQFGFLDICRFVRDMYMEWSGRLLSLLVMALSHALGLEFLRVVQSLIITATLGLVVAVASREADTPFEPLAALFAVAAFLTLPAGTLINGVYWFSAAVHYLWFLPLFLAAAHIAARRQRLTAGAVMLLSAAALAQEQVALGAFAFAVLFVLLVEARGLSRALLKTLPVLAAALFTILAPGNFARARAGAATHDAGVLAGIRDNADLLAGQLFAPGHDKNYFAYVMLTALVLLAVHAARRGPGSPAWWTAIMAGVGAGLAVLYQAGHTVLYMLLFTAAYTAILAAAVWRQRSGRTVLAVHLAGLATLAPLMFSPAVAPRSALPFFVLGLVPAVYAFALMRGLLAGTVRLLLVALLAVKAVDNAGYVYSGFLENARVLEVNDQRLRAAAQQQNARETTGTVELLKVPNSRFAEKMPYQKPVIGTWMKKYYGLDQRVELIWRTPDSRR